MRSKLCNENKYPLKIFDTFFFVVFMFGLVILFFQRIYL